MKMTIAQVIHMADAIKPNGFGNEVKTMWLNECEGQIQTDIMLISTEDIVQYSWPENENTQLLVDTPHSKVYWTYLTAMIDFANGEYDHYTNTMQQFQDALDEFNAWFIRCYHPGDTHGRCYQNDTAALIGTTWRGYFLTAYGIAVKHGFEGDEAAWLESLTGEPGKDVELSFDEERNVIVWRTKGDDAWIDLLDISTLRDEVVNATLDEARAAAEEAADAALESATSASAAQAAAEEAQAARRDLAGKLPAPSTAQVGNLLRIKAVNGDGTFEVEAVRTLEGLGCNTLTLIDSNDGSGDSGTYIVPEGTAEAPVLVLYGLNGDEPVRISNVAPAQADRDVPTLGQVRELVGEAGGGTAGDALGAVVFPSTAANNSTALLTAITAAAALGVGVRIPAGTYVFTEPITLPDGVTVELTGAGDAFANSMNRERIGTEYHAKGYGTTLIYRGEGAMFRHQSCVFKFEDLSLVSQDTDKRYLYTARLVGQTTVDSSTKGKIYLENCLLAGWKTVAGDPFVTKELETALGGTLTKPDTLEQCCIVATRCRFSFCGAALNMGVDSRLDDCSINKCYYGAAFYGSAGFSTLANCRIEWIAYDGVIANQAHDVMVSGCEFDRCGYAAVRLVSCSGCSVVGNTMRRSGADSSLTADAASRNTHLYVSGCSGGVITSNATVKKNIMDDGSSTTIRPVNAYNLQNNSGMAILGNDFSGCTTGSYNRFEGNTDCRVRENVGLEDTEIVLASSTEGSAKQFTVTVDDDGNMHLTDGDGNAATLGAQGPQGEVGPQGAAGADGYTPVKGKDYFTDADIQEIVDEVYAQVVDGNGVAY